MDLSPFHVLYKAYKLRRYAYGKDKLIPVFASTDIKVYPYQVAAAMFALRSQYQKGVIECSEGGLGKSYVSLLIMLQQWYVGKRRILLVLPTHLITKWILALEDKTSIPFFAIDQNTVWNECIDGGQTNPFEQDGLILTTYDFAVEKAEYIEEIKWDITLFDEAHRLCKCYEEDAKEAKILKKAVGESFKVLLTATPIQLNIMDLYGLIWFIDEEVFADADVFYKRYFRKPENYHEIADRAGKYCFRTLRSQAKQYAKIPERIPVTCLFNYSQKEQKLYDMLEQYIKQPKKHAYPEMDQYDIAMMLYKTFASSTFALIPTLKGVVKRLANQAEAKEELRYFEEMLSLAENIQDNTKGKMLLKCLDILFRELRKRGAKKKALIFTESIPTQRYLQKLLSKKYKVVTYHGGKSRNYEIIENFRDEADIMISTDIGSDGLDLEFCSLVVNYDLVYNTLKMEQRIDRCHRLCQDNDVIALALMNKNNYAETRTLQLVGKRVLLMDGVFGLTDDVIGNFTEDIETDLPKILEAARTKDEINRDYDKQLAKNEDENKQAVAAAEDMLFTTFTKELADRVHITPQYAESKSKEIDDDLWEISKWFFEKRNHNYHIWITEETRTIRFVNDDRHGIIKGRKIGRGEYSMDKDYQPKSGRYTITCALVQNMLDDIFWNGTYDRGSITVTENIEPCTIGFYYVGIYENSWHTLRGCHVFVGKTESGRILTDKECRRIMDLPVVDCTPYGECGYRDYLNREIEKRKEFLDDLVDTDSLIKEIVPELDDSKQEEIQKLKAYTQDLKIGLERSVESLRYEVKRHNDDDLKVESIAEKIAAEKRKSMLEKELKQKEQNIFMDGLRLEMDYDEKVKQLTDTSKLKAEVKRHFIIEVKSLG